jgi:putative PEP-CTERM system histidine kinase
MSITIFIITYGILNTALCFSIFFRQKQRVLFIPVFLVAAMAIVHGFAAQAILDYPISASGHGSVNLYFFSALLVLFGLLESIRAFFRPMATKTLFLTDNIEKHSLIFSLLPWRIVAAGSLIFIFFIPHHRAFLTHDLNTGYVLTYYDTILLYLRLIVCLGILFSIENIYRYSQPQQRRMARISFIAFALLAVFDAVFTIRMLLFSTLTPEYIQASIIVYGICITMGLFGFIQFRMMEQKVVISRAGIYSSITLILAGVLFLILGATAFLVQRMGMQFSYFEQFLAVFSVVAVIAVGLSSRWVRLRIAGFVGRNFYKSKYDYRDQFFRLHQTYMAGNQLSDSVNLLLENLVHTVGIGEIFVFLRGTADGHFYLHQVPVQPDQPPVVIKADSPLLSMFHANDTPCIFTDKSTPASERLTIAGCEPLIGTMGLSAVFPIKHRNELVGLLSIKKIHNKNLDKEDQELIKVFTVSIGNVYSTYQMLRERSELKQFESLHHITSFIIHDIKNQVATLTLLSQNARSNMANPEFQQSLLRSIQGCTANLQALIDKLSMPAGRVPAAVCEENINAIAEESLESAGVRSLSSLHIKTCFAATIPIPVDHTSIMYILNNLINNAIEATKGNGTLTIETGDCANLSNEAKQELSIGGHMLTGRNVFLLVRDTGVGMSREFMQQKLFRPFSSTKDKGIGIGLYQSKTLIERMGGHLVCYSKPGTGTTFCCIL